jgi:hypothetical protein
MNLIKNGSGREVQEISLVLELWIHLLNLVQIFMGNYIMTWIFYLYDIIY